MENSTCYCIRVMIQDCFSFTKSLGKILLDEIMKPWKFFSYFINVREDEKAYSCRIISFILIKTVCRFRSMCQYSKIRSYKLCNGQWTRKAIRIFCPMRNFNNSIFLSCVLNKLWSQSIQYYFSLLRKILELINRKIDWVNTEGKLESYYDSKPKPTFRIIVPFLKMLNPFEEYSNVVKIIENVFSNTSSTNYF